MKSTRLCLVLGGVRSGKSAFAERLAGEAGGPTIYLATGVPVDDEMKERIRRHQQSRPPDWTTVEEPLDLAGSLEAIAPTQMSPGVVLPGVVLIDSLDVWVANMMLEQDGQPTSVVESAVLGSVDRTLAAIARAHASFVLVSSEVGLSLVPAEPLGRRFQDLLGTVNQRVATAADRVYLVVAGVAMPIKEPTQ